MLIVAYDWDALARLGITTQEVTKSAANFVNETMGYL